MVFSAELVRVNTKGKTTSNTDRRKNAAPIPSSEDVCPESVETTVIAGIETERTVGSVHSSKNGGLGERGDKHPGKTLPLN